MYWKSAKQARIDTGRRRGQARRVVGPACRHAADAGAHERAGERRFVSAGLVNAASGRADGVDGRPRPGVVDGAVPTPGVVNGDVPNPGVVNGDVPSPGGSNVVGALEPEPVNRLVGRGGRLIPNCDRPCDSADISSLGRSVTIAAWTNWRCCVGGLAFSERSDTATIAAGLATARAATALMAVESLRRRRFGTEVSSIYGLRLVGARG